MNTETRAQELAFRMGRPSWAEVGSYEKDMFRDQIRMLDEMVTSDVRTSGNRAVYCGNTVSFHSVDK